MFIIKKKYFLLIESIKDIDLKNIKLPNKFVIIYRNRKNQDNFEKLRNFRRRCKAKRIDFFVSNDTKLLTDLKADGLYISSYNIKLILNKYKNYNYKIIGSAHNIRELLIKLKQGCEYFIFSRLFKTKYKFKKSYLGILKYNLLANTRRENLVPLGGININNLNSLRLVNSNAIMIFSEIKKKPANIINRLF